MNLSFKVLLIAAATALMAWPTQASADSHHRNYYRGHSYYAYGSRPYYRGYYYHRPVVWYDSPYYYDDYYYGRPYYGYPGYYRPTIALSFGGGGYGRYGYYRGYHHSYHRR